MELPQIVLQQSHYLVVYILLEIFILQRFLALVEITANAASHSVSVPASAFQIYVTNKPARGSEVEQRVGGSVRNALVRALELLERLAETELDQQNTQCEQRRVLN